MPDRSSGSSSSSNRGEGNRGEGWFAAIYRAVGWCFHGGRRRRSQNEVRSPHMRRPPCSSYRLFSRPAQESDRQRVRTRSQPAHRPRTAEPLPAAPPTIVGYIGWLAERGTIGADSLQPYLSAINSMHADHGLERPALGHLVRRARQGMARRQAALQTRDTRVPLPAEHVDLVCTPSSSSTYTELSTS